MNPRISNDPPASATAGGNGQYSILADQPGVPQVDESSGEHPRYTPKVLIKRARRVVREALPPLPLPDKTQALAVAKVSLMATPPSKPVVEFGAAASHRWNQMTHGVRAEAASLDEAMDQVGATLARQTERARRSVNEVTPRLEKRGESEPWQWWHACQIPLVAAISIWSLYLGWSFVRFLVEDSGVLQNGQAWTVAAGGILAVATIELFPIALRTYAARQKYLLILLVAGAAGWAGWGFTFAKLYGSALFETSTLGATGQNDLDPSLGVLQIGLQLFAEVVSSGACLVAIQVLGERHGGLSSVTNPEFRRRSNVLARLQKISDKVQVEQAALRGKILEINSNAALVEANAKRAVEELIRLLDAGWRPVEQPVQENLNPPAAKPGTVPAD